MASASSSRSLALGPLEPLGSTVVLGKQALAQGGGGAGKYELNGNAGVDAYFTRQLGADGRRELDEMFATPFGADGAEMDQMWQEFTADVWDHKWIDLCCQLLYEEETDGGVGMQVESKGLPLMILLARMYLRFEIEVLTRRNHGQREAKMKEPIGDTTRLLERIKDHVVPSAIFQETGTGWLLDGGKLREDLPVHMFSTGSSVASQHAMACVVVSDDSDRRVVVINTGYMAPREGPIAEYKRVVTTESMARKSVEYTEVVYPNKRETALYSFADLSLRMIGATTEIMVMQDFYRMALVGSFAPILESELGRFDARLVRAKARILIQDNRDIHDHPAIGPRFIPGAPMQKGGTCGLYSLAHMFGYAMAVLDVSGTTSMQRYWYFMRMFALYSMVRNIFHVVSEDAGSHPPTEIRRILFSFQTRLLSDPESEYCRAKFLFSFLPDSDKEVKKSPKAVRLMLQQSLWDYSLDNAYGTSGEDISKRRSMCRKYPITYRRGTPKTESTLPLTLLRAFMADAGSSVVCTKTLVTAMENSRVLGCHLLARRIIMHMYRKNIKFDIQGTYVKSISTPFVTMFGSLQHTNGTTEMFMTLMLVVMRTFNAEWGKYMVPIERIAECPGARCELNVADTTKLIWTDKPRWLDTHRVLAELNELMRTCAPWFVTVARNLVIVNTTFKLTSDDAKDFRMHKYRGSTTEEVEFRKAIDLCCAMVMFVNSGETDDKTLNNWNSELSDHIVDRESKIKYSCCTSSMYYSMHYKDHDRNKSIVMPSWYKQQNLEMQRSNLLQLLTPASDTDEVELAQIWPHVTTDEEHCVPRFKYTHSASTAPKLPHGTAAVLISQRGSDRPFGGYDDAIAMRRMVRRTIHDERRCRALLNMNPGSLHLFLMTMYGVLEDKEIQACRPLCDVVNTVHDAIFVRKVDKHVYHQLGMLIKLLWLICNGDVEGGIANVNRIYFDYHEYTGHKTRTDAIDMISYWVAKSEAEYYGDKEFESLIEIFVKHQPPETNVDINPLIKLAKLYNVIKQNPDDEGTALATYSRPTGSGSYDKIRQFAIDKHIIYMSPRISELSICISSDASELNTPFTARRFAAKIGPEYSAIRVALSSETGDFVLYGLRHASINSGRGAPLEQTEIVPESDEIVHTVDAVFDWDSNKHAIDYLNTEILVQYGTASVWCNVRGKLLPSIIVSAYSRPCLYFRLVNDDSDPRFSCYAAVRQGRVFRLASRYLPERYTNPDDSTNMSDTDESGDESAASSSDEKEDEEANVRDSNAVPALYSRWFAYSHGSATCYDELLKTWHVLCIADEKAPLQYAYYPLGGNMYIDDGLKDKITDILGTVSQYSESGNINVVVDIHPNGLWLLPLGDSSSEIDKSVAVAAVKDAVAMSGELATQNALAMDTCGLSKGSLRRWRIYDPTTVVQRPRFVSLAISIGASISAVLTASCDKEEYCVISTGAGSDVRKDNLFVADYKGCCMAVRKSTHMEQVISTLKQKLDNLGALRKMLRKYVDTGVASDFVVRCVMHLVDPREPLHPDIVDAEGMPFGDLHNPILPRSGETDVVLRPADIIIRHGAPLREWCYAILMLPLLDQTISRIETAIETAESASSPGVLFRDVSYAIELIDPLLVHAGPITIVDMLAEIASGYIMRSDQRDLTRGIVESYGNPAASSTARRLIMGGGKSSFVTPWLVFHDLLDSQTRRAFVTVPRALFEQAVDSMLGPYALFGGSPLGIFAGSSSSNLPIACSAVRIESLQPNSTIAIGADSSDAAGSSKSHASPGSPGSKDTRSVSVVDSDRKSDEESKDDEEGEEDEDSEEEEEEEESDKEEDEDEEDSDEEDSDGETPRDRRSRLKYEAMIDSPDTAKFVAAPEVAERGSGLRDVRVVMSNDKALQAGLLVWIGAGKLPREWYRAMVGETLIFDEVDSMTDPLTCETNMPSGEEKHLRDVAPLIELLEQLNAEVYSSSAALGPLVQHTDGGVQGRQYMGGKSARYENTYPMLVEKYRVAFRAIGPGGAMAINRTYGFGDYVASDPTNHLIAIPYSSANSPVNGSRFTDLELLVVLTYRCYRAMIVERPTPELEPERCFRRLDMEELAAIAGDVGIVSYISKSISKVLPHDMCDAFKRFCMPQRYIKRESSTEEAYNAFVVLLTQQPADVRIAFFRLHAKTIIERHISYHVGQNNVGMLEFMSPDLSTRRAMFSGTLRIHLHNEKTAQESVRSIDAVLGTALHSSSTHRAIVQTDPASDDVTISKQSAFVRAMMDGFVCKGSPIGLAPLILLHNNRGADSAVADKQSVQVVCESGMLATFLSQKNVVVTGHDSDGASSKYGALIDAAGVLRSNAAVVYARVISVCCVGQPVYYVSQTGAREMVRCVQRRGDVARILPVIRSDITPGHVVDALRCAAMQKDLGCVLETARYAGEQTPDDALFLYDQRSTIGIDFKQPKSVAGLLSVDKFTTYTAAVQAAFRLRKLGRGHSFDYYVLSEPRSRTSAAETTSIMLAKVFGRQPGSDIPRAVDIVVRMLLPRDEYMMDERLHHSRVASAIAMLRMLPASGNITRLYHQPIFVDSDAIADVAAGASYDMKEKMRLVAVHTDGLAKMRADLVSPVIAEVRDGAGVVERFFAKELHKMIATDKSDAMYGMALSTAVAQKNRQVEEEDLEVVVSVRLNAASKAKHTPDSFPEFYLDDPLVNDSYSGKNASAVDWLVELCAAARQTFGINVSPGAQVQFLHEFNLLDGTPSDRVVDRWASDKSLKVTPHLYPFYILVVALPLPDIRPAQRPTRAVQLHLIGYRDAMAYLAVPDEFATKHLHRPYAIYEIAGHLWHVSYGHRSIFPAELATTMITIDGGGTYSAGQPLVALLRSFSLLRERPALGSIDAALVPGHLRRFFANCSFDVSMAPSSRLDSPTKFVTAYIDMPHISSAIQGPMDSDSSSDSMFSALRSCAYCSAPAALVCGHCLDQMSSRADQRSLSRCAAYCSRLHQFYHLNTHIFHI